MKSTIAIKVILQKVFFLWDYESYETNSKSVSDEKRSLIKKVNFFLTTLIYTIQTDMTKRSQLNVTCPRAKSKKETINHESNELQSFRVQSSIVNVIYTCITLSCALLLREKSQHTVYFCASVYKCIVLRWFLPQKPANVERYIVVQ